MNNQNSVFVAFLLLSMLVSGCSNIGIDPITPSDQHESIQGSTSATHQYPQGSTSATSQDSKEGVNLWGYFDVYIDIPTQTATAILNRQAMFTANVVNFINGKPANLGFHINDTPVGVGYVDVDIDVTITHPFPGLHQYDGYDVRGVFMGNSSNHLAYNPDLSYAVLGTDQFMLADPYDEFGSPDGYTRWFNKPEFSGAGMPLFQYTQGKVATPNFDGTATLNPYKYFADNLGKNDNLWTWLADNPSAHGIFTSGSTNTRNYYLRFPSSPGVKYGYAVIANWAGTAPEFHPSNAPEAVAVQVADNSNVFYGDSSNKGGSLNFDISVWDWDSQISAGMMEDYKLFIESTVLLNPYELSTSEKTPTGGGENFSTYHVEILPDNIQGVDGNEYWIIVEQQGHDYTNSFGVSNLADTDPLTALFRFDLPVSPTATNYDPVCNLDVVTSTPINGWDAGTPVSFDASGSSDPDGDTLTYAWDFDGDGTYGESVDDQIDSGTPDKPTHIYKTDFTGQPCVQVTDGKGGKSVCCEPVQVTVHQSKNIPLRPSVLAKDIAVNSNDGTLYVLYSDAQIWKYSPATWYSQSSGSYFMTSYSGVAMLDVSQKNYLIVAGKTINGDIFNYDPSGNFLGGYWTWFAGPVRDVSTFPDSGTYANCHSLVFGYNNVGTQYSYIEEWTYPNFVLPNMHVNAINPPFTGYSILHSDWARGIECVTDAIWAVETTDYYAARFKLVPYGFNYDGAYVGTGAQTEADNGFYNPLDLTIDSQGRIFVLDSLSTGAPKIKVFESTGEPGGSVGSFGNTTNISGDPLKIEGSNWVDPDYGNMIFVLHGSTAPGKISVFFPSEMP